MNWTGINWTSSFPRFMADVTGDRHALDAADYRPTLRRLANGDLTLRPTDRLGTPVRVILGDYLGDVGVIERDAAGTHFGIRWRSSRSRRT